MGDAPRTAEEAYESVAGQAKVPLAPQNVPLEYSTPFVCPYCEVNSQHLWGSVTSLTVYPSPSSQGGRRYEDDTLVAAKCQSCYKETLFKSGKVIVPNYSSAPASAADMPEEIAADFEEARQIVNKSPRGAAALLRLAIQKLCPLLGATKPDINAAIGELVAAGKITAALQQALDTVRVVGNEAVHPGSLDLRDDQATANALFGLVNYIVEKAITEPKKIAELYATLPPAKLAGIGQRDKSVP